MQHKFSSGIAAYACLTAAFVLPCVTQLARAQDIRGIEVCTAEKDMGRRTGCLQANASLLQDLLNKEVRRAQAVEAGAAREIAALKAELASLKAVLDKAQAEIAGLKKSADTPAKK